MLNVDMIHVSICCGPHTTVASTIKYKNDDGKTGLYCIQPEGYDR